MAPKKKKPSHVMRAIRVMTHHKSMFRWLNILDPIYWFAYMLSASILDFPLRESEIEFVHDNIIKHRKVLWCNLIMAMLVAKGLTGLSIVQVDTLIGSLVAPAFITGGAWFAITFGGVPKRLLPLAIDITFWMFAAFTVSLTTMFVGLCFVLPPLVLVVFGFILFAILVSAVRYDNVDGLKIGLDEALLMHSLTHINYLSEKQGAEIVVDPSKLSINKRELDYQEDV
ncbi:MAG: hypothetical protein NTX72_00670 [Candidatus Uhrbacteria bacterium]|nr:hypothetical protein [Candidatus Uhrbacteria bacterium]